MIVQQSQKVIEKEAETDRKKAVIGERSSNVGQGFIVMTSQRKTML